MDCTFSKNANKKHTNMEKNFMDKPSSVLSPKTSETTVFLSLPLLINTAMRELNIIAVEAKRVDAIMLFLKDCTARTPFLDTSYTSHDPKSMLVLTNIEFN